MKTKPKYFDAWDLFVTALLAAFLSFIAGDVFGEWRQGPRVQSSVNIAVQNPDIYSPGALLEIAQKVGCGWLLINARNRTVQGGCASTAHK